MKRYFVFLVLALCVVGCFVLNACGSSPKEPLLPMGQNAVAEHEPAPLPSNFQEIVWQEELEIGSSNVAK